LKPLSSLLERLPESTVVQDDGLAVAISQISADSREIVPGALFIAIAGEHEDGHDFIPQALARGASAVIVEHESALDGVSVPVIRVADAKAALSRVAAAFFDDPSRALEVAGVTGTNGKTTTTRMIAAICNAANVPCGVIGTVGAEFAGQSWSLTHTTPLPQELHALLARMRDAGARAVAMEVSSHALAAERVEDVRFSCATLTNVTRDHLDFHGTREAYARAKRRLFDLASAAVLNVDDEFGRCWAAELHGKIPVLTYASNERADLVARDVAVRSNGSSFALDRTRMHLNVPARFNVANALAAIGTARTLGIEDAVSARGLATLTRVPGRMEHVGNGEVDVVVDYAHTPDALEQALLALREAARGEIGLVFGCGGDRDRGKRSAMGRIAARLADRIYVTNDNPRSEPPEAIAAAIEQGIGAHPHVVELDRKAAIERAVFEAAPGDVVLIAGKGHEPYQIVGDRVLPFDDVLVAREALQRRIG
jgi:UDP-N-acetylmuramoyl-L-alanyl-D-glutamate--2,6-diaminopimelate ligase